MRIALVSLNQLWESKKENLRLCTQYVLRASKMNCNLIIFPEMTLTGFSMNPEKLSERLNNSDTISQFMNLARANMIAVQFGIILNQENSFYNTSITLDSEGNLISLYKKIHPFSFAKEDDKFSSGNELVTSEINGVKIGSTICYDLRFPELYSALAKNCTVIINIANWPSIRIEHWKKLMMARAIENQLFLVGVNRSGTDGNLIRYEESSIVVSPDGRLKTPYFSDNEFQVFELDMIELAKHRSAFPTYQDRRTDLYRKFI